MDGGGVRGILGARAQMILDQFGEPYIDPSVLPNFNLNIQSAAVSAKPRKMQAKWSQPAADNFREMFGSPSFKQHSVVDRLAALAFSTHRDVAQRIAGLPDDLVPPDVKDMALGAILDLIPKAHWPDSWGSTALEWEESVLGTIQRVVQERAG